MGKYGRANVSCWENPDEPGDDMDMEEVGVAIFVATRESSSWWELSTKFQVVYSFADAVPSTETSVCGRDRTNRRFSSALEYIASVPAVCAATARKRVCRTCR